MTNTSDSGLFADLELETDGPLQLSRTLISTWLPAADPDQTVTTPLMVNVPHGTAANSHTISLTLDRRRVGEIAVEVVEPDPKPDGSNVLYGEQVITSTTHGNFATCAVVDGITDSTRWPTGGWNDSTSHSWPDTVDVVLPDPRTIGRVDLYTLDSTTYPASQYGLADWDVQLRVDGTWVTVSSVRGNTVGEVSSTFPPQQSDAVRVVALASNNSDYARILEIEAFSN